jgi:hypothetical protein
MHKSRGLRRINRRKRRKGKGKKRREGRKKLWNQRDQLT